MYPDELRDPDALRRAEERRLAEDHVALLRAYGELVDREREARGRAARLSDELRVLRSSQQDVPDLRRRIADAHAALSAYRNEVRRLKADLRRVRTSTSMRVGKAVLAPAQTARRAARRLVEAPRPRPDVAIVPAGERTGEGVRRSKMSVEDLLRRVATEGTQGDLHALLSRLWFDSGEISRPAAIAAEYPELVAQLEDAGLLLVEQIRSAHRVRESGWPVPPRSRGTTYQVERGRVMYCVHSTPVFDSNGYSVRTGGVATGLVANGADVVVVARSGYPWEKARRTSSMPRRRTVHRQGPVDYVHNPGVGLGSATLEQYLEEAADTFVREARLLRPEVIHAASDVHTALPALVCARRVGVPFVYEVRGLWEVTAASTRPGWEGSERYELQIALETLVAAEADAVLAITPQIADVLVSRGVDRGRIHLLPNAVDPDDVLPLPPDRSFPAGVALREDVVRIGYTGSLVPYEGLDLLVDAMDVLRSRGVEAELVIAGSGPSEESLRRQVSELGLEGTVHLLGRIAHDDVPRLVSRLDIMTCPRPSLPVTELVSPLKPLESFAASKAVVLSDVAPHRELAGPGEERALLARAGDPVALADRLEELIRDKDLRRRLGRRARLWIRDERTWATVCGEAVRAYEEAARIADRTPPGRQLGDLRVGTIADEFTTMSLRGTVQVVAMDRHGWPAQLAAGIDLLFVESAWRGNGGQWERGVGYYSDEEHADLRALVAACRERGVPVVFWNKEDPVHTQRFLPAAVLCDHVFTVDASLVPHYVKAGGGRVRTAAGLPFFAQPRIHNPLPGRRAFERTVAYAGTYYGERYPDRTTALNRLLAAARGVGLAIYDRQLTEKDSPYRFPDQYRREVRGGLPYEEVLDTYTAHLAHLNVNSVTDSPTMFSRRVVEIAASGGVVLSAAGRGLSETLGEAVPATDDAAELAAWLRLWREDPAARRREAWHQLRAIYRAHTAPAALAIVARTAGIATDAESLPAYAVAVDVLGRDEVEAVVRQSWRPRAVVVPAETRVEDDIELSLSRAGVHVVVSLEDLDEDVEWVGRLPHSVSRTWFEDLLVSSWFGDWERLDVSHGEDGGPALVRVSPSERSSGSGLVRLRTAGDAASLDEALTAGSTDRLVVGPPADDRPAPEGMAVTGASSAIAGTPRPRTLLVAGHDLKFLEAAFPLLEQQGLAVQVDRWSSHTDHDPERSQDLLAGADVVLCEWGLGNAVWYSRNVLPEQTLLVRVHSQELFGPHLARVAHDRVDAYVFVSELVRAAATVSHGVPRERTTVVPNLVDVAGLALPKHPEAHKSIGFVGMVPQQKRLDLALDLLELVHQHDPNYRLVVRGRRPEEYAWLQQREDELAYYARQMSRVEEIASRRPGSVILSPHGSDMAEWYRGVDTVISTSDFESFHMTIPDGVASGALPAVLLWPGADVLYPRSWLFATLEEMATGIVTRSPVAGAADVASLAQERVVAALVEVIERAGRG